MVRTTPIEKSDQHKDWHVFIPSGLCLYCGWHCDDCPLDVATCKCVSVVKKDDTPEARADKLLKAENSGITDSWQD